MGTYVVGKNAIRRIVDNIDRKDEILRDLGWNSCRCRWTCGCVKALKSLYYCMLKAVRWNLSFIFFKLVMYFKQYRNVNDIKWIFVFRQVFYNLLIKISQMMFLRWHFFYFEILSVFVCGPGSSVGIVTDYGLDGPGSNPSGDEIFRLSRLALGPTHPPVEWVPCLSRG